MAQGEDFQLQGGAAAEGSPEAGENGDEDVNEGEAAEEVQLTPYQLDPGLWEPQGHAVSHDSVEAHDGQN